MKYLCCEPAQLHYLPPMDWQQIVSLTIVGITAVAFLWSKTRSRRFGFTCDTGCGCAAAGPATPQNSIVFRARKGGRPQIVVSMK
ncbi:MAG: hypothetical protein HY674_08925 [Chloroflexi bacterium]|nr:hypothetical protein [Chloroflexota bacterium]